MVYCSLLTIFGTEYYTIFSSEWTTQFVSRSDYGGGKIIHYCKAGFARGDQGTESLWLDSQLSVVDVPSRVRSPGGNRG